MYLKLLQTSCHLLTSELKVGGIGHKSCQTIAEEPQAHKNTPQHPNLQRTSKLPSSPGFKKYIYNKKKHNPPPTAYGKRDLKITTKKKEKKSMDGRSSASNIQRADEFTRERERAGVGGREGGRRSAAGRGATDRATVKTKKPASQRACFHGAGSTAIELLRLPNALRGLCRCKNPSRRQLSKCSLCVCLCVGVRLQTVS